MLKQPHWQSPAAAFLTLHFAFLAGPALAQSDIDFTREIRPILSDNCFACHGPNEGDREGGFRLDRSESALGEADSGERPIVPGHPDQSELVARITSDDDLQMPPPDTGKRLTPQEIELLRRWIEQGATWRDHWSFITHRLVEPPPVGDEAWCRNPVDRFTLARLEREGMTPSPQADPVVLIRRVTFDLTGLPPTLAEVEAFLGDPSGDAYENVVDRLLESDHYGEHMARFWLDAARYGDTHGLHLDNYREMWPYRDWVVRAFNRNLPYDQFTVEQLAGDLLPSPTRDQLVATGFNRAHVTTSEGGSIEEEVYVRNVVDRVVTMGTVFMGITFECSRCHDHKFDPFTMNDFYSLFAFFNSIDGKPLDGNRKDHAPVLRVPTPEQKANLAEFNERIAALEQKLRDPWPALDETQAAWEQRIASTETATGGEEPATITLGDWFTVGPFKDNRRYLWSRKHGPEGEPIELDDEFRLATGNLARWTRRSEWTDGKTHYGLPGGIAANFLYRSVTTLEPRTLSVSLGSDDAIKVYLNNKQVFGKNVTRSAAPDQDSLELQLQQGENDLLVKIMNYGDKSGFYFAPKSLPVSVPDELLKVVRSAVGDRTGEERQALRDFYRNKVADFARLDAVRSELAALRTDRAELDARIPTTLIWREAEKPKPAFYLTRGEYDQRATRMSRRTPAALPPMDPRLPSDRLGLAKWLVDPAHPLTARVAVNRFWLQVFGTGIVKTAEDFGSQGEPPTHPELLDWLAARFVTDGWDVKAMMKRIVMSATYRQSSRVTADAMQRDPENRLLARGPRFRLDAEMLRDQALAVSGLLVDKLGGPSVKPPQPDGLWFAVGYSGSNTVRFTPDTGPDKVHRRTLYTFIKRTSPPPQMSIVDAPSRESCVVRRERTNTPLLSLLLLNDPQFVEAARGLAERTMSECEAGPRARAEHMFRLCLFRHPSEAELRELTTAFTAELKHFTADVPAARELAGVGEMPPNSDSDVRELAAWTMIGNLLLNLDEVVTEN